MSRALLHRCHLERRPADHRAAARAICACGWAGTWHTNDARAVEQGTTHIIKSQGGR
jgi:hypothetical protein